MTGLRFDNFDRTQGIGASEVPAILGRSPWATPVGVWMEKVGLPSPRRETPAMRTGVALEGAVLGLASDEARGPGKLTRNRVTFLHPAWPKVRLFGTPDGFTRGRWGTVEVKVVGHHWSDWADGPPEYVRLQVAGQWAVIPKATHAIVIALLGSDVKTFDLPRDEGLVRAVEADVRSYWDAYVAPEVAPPADTSDDRWAVLRVLAERSGNRVSRVATDEEEVEAARLIALTDARSDVAAEIDLIRLRLAEAATEGDLAGSRWRGTWADRRNVDWSAVARDLGARAGDIEAHTTTQRVFTFRRSRAAEEDAT